MAVYSRTPQVKKLGVKKESRLLLTGAPQPFEEKLGLLPPGTIFAPDLADRLGLVLLFVQREEGLRELFASCAARLASTGRLWI